MNVLICIWFLLVITLCASVLVLLPIFLYFCIWSGLVLVCMCVFIRATVSMWVLQDKILGVGYYLPPRLRQSISCVSCCTAQSKLTGPPSPRTFSSPNSAVSVLVLQMDATTSSFLCKIWGYEFRPSGLCRKCSDTLSLLHSLVLKILIKSHKLF